jgi:erythromycin esterase-like protein
LAPEGNLDYVLLRSGLPLFILDLRLLPARGFVTNWFGAPRTMREIGAVFMGEQWMSVPIVAADRYDAIAFIKQTTRARPLE